MAIYVLAFTDTDLGTWKWARRTLRTTTLGAIFAVGERRNAVPHMPDDVLRAQHEAVIEIARRSRATLPVRFGALIDERELADWVRSREVELHRALDDVRDRVQMTIRILGEPGPVARTAHAATSGRAYLESRRQALAPSLPRTAQDVLRTLRPLVAHERIEAGHGGLLATVYHLVSQQDVAAYRDVMKETSADLVISGPWPPFAFTPPLW